ncbi:MAG: hypothetical protein M0Z66_06585 [Thermaerobacter sp.]|nr:hypothetical protein [Thermaerobacter sp.]
MQARKFRSRQLAVAWAAGGASAARYFADVRRHWSQFRVIDQPPLPPEHVVSEVQLSANVIAYRLPNTAGGLEVNGVAYSGLVNNASGLPFEQMNAYLPKGDHSLATLILNYFLQNDLNRLP